MLNSPMYRINQDNDAYSTYKKFKLFPVVSADGNPIETALARSEFLVDAYKAACEFYQDKACNY